MASRPKSRTTTDTSTTCSTMTPVYVALHLSHRHVLVNSRGGRARHHHVNGMGGYGTTATTTSISARGSREQATSSLHADVRTTFDDDVIGIRLEAGGRWLRAAVRCIDGSSTSYIDDSSRPTILMTHPLRLLVNSRTLVGCTDPHQCRTRGG